MTDEQLLVFLDEDISPEILDERAGEELSSQLVIVLLENQEHFAFLPVFV